MRIVALRMDGPSGHYVGILSAFISFLPRNFIDFIRDLITLFREVEKDAVQLKESRLIEFFYRFFQHKIYYYFKQHIILR